MSYCMRESKGRGVNRSSVSQQGCALNIFSIVILVSLSLSSTVAEVSRLNYIHIYQIKS